MTSQPLRRDGLDAAERALALCCPGLSSSSAEYGARLKSLAEFHAKFGRDRFELFFGLRQPRTKEEEWARDCQHGKITLEELGRRLKQDAERPLDLEMLTTFHEHCNRNIAHYSSLIRAAADALRPQCTLPEIETNERTIAQHVKAMTAKFPLWSDNLKTVFSFLEEMRVRSRLGLVKVGEFEGTSAHWITMLVVERAVQAWQNCTEIAHRSQTDASYLYSTTASALFFKTCLPELPKPQSLLEHCREEFLYAKEALASSTGDAGTCGEERRHTILFLAAGPTDQDRLRLDEEFREIQEKLRLAELREKFTIEARTAVRPHDISQALLDVRPRFVHFSGHGTAVGAICCETPTGETLEVSPDALADLFKQFADHVQCVILNACYSKAQAEAVGRHIKYVIGMRQGIGDRAAIAFSVGFYQALGAGCAVEKAYKLGCAQIKMQGIAEHLTPLLVAKQDA